MCACSVIVLMKEMSEAKKLKPGPKRKSSDSARKRNKKAENAKLNKNRIYIGDEYDGNKGRCSSGNELWSGQDSFWQVTSFSISPNGAPRHSLLPISMFLSSFSNKLIKSEWNSLQLIIFKVKHTWKNFFARQEMQEI